ncbi:MAG: 3-hydroxybutyryl-CoA dehydrogenase [Deltaproteobacteria bacterium]|nr:3-hydroxybutyryl-CoA dehydrogenase [Deltaproteobacteria bacterium]MBW2137229.1 3-hydroxybutyryl-CoA dehydrogenase [Deltaproteobacteria bacterium]
MSDLLLLCPRNLDDPWVRGIPDRVSRLHGTPKAQDLRSKRAVLEAFPEGDEKDRILLSLAQNEKWSGPVASLYTLQSVTSLATKSGLGARLIGFQPSPGGGENPGVELLRGEETSQETARDIREVFEDLGFRVFLCRDQAGGILPRVLVSIINEAAYMAWAGIAPPEKIDTMMRLGANFPMGPFQWADHIGLDRVLGFLECLSRELGSHYQPCPWIRRKVEAGKLGIKTGEGFYRYEEGGGR